MASRARASHTTQTRALCPGMYVEIRTEAVCAPSAVTGGDGVRSADSATAQSKSIVIVVGKKKNSRARFFKLRVGSVS